MGLVYLLGELIIFVKRKKQSNKSNHKINYKFPKQIIQLIIHLFFFFCFLLSINFTLLRFVTGTVSTEGKTTDLDIFYVLDTSLSMNTEDMKGQSRIDNAKDTLLDFSLKLENHRIGLVTYNHIAIVESPLSNDRDMLSTALETVSTVEYMYANGSFASVGLEKAYERFFPKNDVLTDRGKIIVLLSDGTDSRKYDLSLIIDKLNDKNIPVYTVGVGTKSGGTIPWMLDEDEKRTVTYDNRDVISTLEDESLIEISENTGGKYFTISNMDELEKVIRNSEYKISPNTNSPSTIYEETYFISSIISLLLLLLTMFNINDYKIKLRKKRK